MLRRFTSFTPSTSATAATAAVASAGMFLPTRTFFGKGWDNASVDVVYRGLLRKPEVNTRLVQEVAGAIDGRTIEQTAAIYKRLSKTGGQMKVFLGPHIGDPHRLLKAYSLTAYPILDEHGEQLKISVEGASGEAFADPDDDFSKIVLPNLELTKFLAQELLSVLDWEQSPRGAASLLESLYRGSEIPDHVFQTAAVIERREEKK